MHGRSDLDKRLLCKFNLRLLPMTPMRRVELFKDLVEGEMDDEDNLTVVFNKTLAQIKATSTCQASGTMM